jgi:hypothetical protein
MIARPEFGIDDSIHREVNRLRLRERPRAAPRRISVM